MSEETQPLEQFGWMRGRSSSGPTGEEYIDVRQELLNTHEQLRVTLEKLQRLGTAPRRTPGRGRNRASTMGSGTRGAARRAPQGRSTNPGAPPRKPTGTSLALRMLEARRRRDEEDRRGNS